MSERVYYTAIDGRQFTLKQWGEYLDAHPNNEDLHEPYISVEGFDFNIHGYCINAHVLRVNPEQFVNGIRCYYDLRTYRRFVSLTDRRVMWWYDLFEIGCGAHGFGWVEGDETDAILKGLHAAAVAIEKHMQWHQRSLDMDIANWGHSTMGYEAQIARDKAMLAMTREMYDIKSQLSLFDL